MLYKKILFIIFYLLLFASYSFASNISEYKYEVSSYAKSLKSKYNLKKINEYYSSFLERAIYSDMGYTADFILPLSDITSATLIHHRFKDIEYFFKENPNTAPFMYNKLFKTSGNIISIESANNDKLSVIAVITSYEPYDYNYNNRNETYTAYICKPDFIDCIESDMAVHDNSEHTESIWAKNDYITFKTFKNTHDDSKEQHNYVTYKLKNGKYYL